MNKLKKHLKQKVINPGDKVKYKYTHWFNSKSCSQKVKFGKFIRKITSKKVD